MGALLQSGWFGKALGLVAGVLWGLPDVLNMAICAAAGVGVGHLYDRSLRPDTRAVLLMDETLPVLRPGSTATDAFLGFAFASLGAVAKARGRVSEASIAWAEEVIEQMRLAPADRERAIAAFTRGKDPYADLEGLGRALRRAVGPRSSLVQVCMELACAAGQVDGPPDAAVRGALHRVRGILGLSRRQLRNVEALVLHRPRRSPPPIPDVGERRLQEARELLDVAADASQRDLKRAYRRQMSRHHPDKVVGRGADAAAVRRAELQAQRIADAYQVLAAARRTAIGPADEHGAARPGRRDTA